MWVPDEVINNIGSGDSLTAGLVILGPVDTSSNRTRSALGCAIDARWIDSLHIQDDGALDITIYAQSSYTSKPPPGLTGYGFLPIGTHWPRIRVNSEWLDALTPKVPFLLPDFQLSAPASTIANLLISTSHAQIPSSSFPSDYLNNKPYHFWEYVVSTLFADGIARIGYTRQLSSIAIYVNGSDSTSRQCKYPIGSPSICHGPPPGNGKDYTVMELNGFNKASKFSPVFGIKICFERFKTSLSISSFYHFFVILLSDSTFHCLRRS